MPTYRPATARRYRELHKQRVMAFFGSKALDAIGPGDFRAFAASLHTDGVQTKGPITLVRTVVRAAHECGLIERLPECPSGLVVTSRKVADAPSSEEVDAMLRAAGLARPRDRSRRDGRASHGRGSSPRSEGRRLRTASHPGPPGDVGGSVAHAQERSREGGPDGRGPRGSSARGRKGQAAASSGCFSTTRA